MGDQREMIVTHTKETLLSHLAFFRNEFDSYLMEGMQAIEEMEDIDDIPGSEWDKFNEDLVGYLSTLRDAVQSLKLQRQSA